MRKILALLALLAVSLVATGAHAQSTTYAVTSGNWEFQTVWSNVVSGSDVTTVYDNGATMPDASTGPWTTITNPQNGTYSGTITIDGSGNIISGSLIVTGSIANTIQSGATTFWGHQYQGLVIDFAAKTATTITYTCEDAAPPVSCVVVVPSVGTFPGGGDAAAAKVFEPLAGFEGNTATAHSGATFDGTTLEIFHEAWSGTEAATEYLNTFTLTASIVLNDVPDVTGQAQATAEANITGAGLTVGNVTTATDDIVAIGDVISQNPVDCTACANDGDPVDLVVSLGPSLDVPDVTGQLQATAEANIIAESLTVGTVTTAPDAVVPAGDIISQNPTVCASCALTDDPVDLVVSSGPPLFDVPDVTGQAQATAEANIIAASLTVGNVTTATDAVVPIGDVISQNPMACIACAGAGDAIDLVVSLGPAIDIPDVTGQPQATAEANITGVGLTVGTVTTVADNMVPAGDVISQNPVACTACAIGGDPVDLVVSSGPPMFDVPDVTGQPQADAETLITDNSLTVGTVTTALSPTVPVGNVISQSPVACTACAGAGDAVDLVVSLGPPLDVPDVTGQPQATAEANIIVAGLTVGTVATVADDVVPAGDVISQNPVACTDCAASGDPVNLLVSLGAGTERKYPGSSAINPFSLAGLLMVVPWLRRRYPRTGARR